MMSVISIYFIVFFLIDLPRSLTLKFVPNVIHEINNIIITSSWELYTQKEYFIHDRPQVGNSVSIRIWQIFSACVHSDS